MESIQKHLFVLILAGGGGTRLWPESRENSPKQFSKLFDGKSLFDITLQRALKVTSPSNIIISTSQKYLHLVRSVAKKIPAENIIAEPMRRDTALAIGVATALAFKKDPDSVLINMASDHLINPVEVFVNQLHQAAAVAVETSQFVTIGIKPKFPHTGMGHIKARKAFPGLPGALLGEKFVEKPALPLAQKYTKSGDYFWNTNLFVFRSQLFLKLLEKYSPKVYSQLPRLMDAFGTTKEKEILQTVYQMSPSIAVDYAVAEHLRKFVCIPAKFNWTDVGDWKEVYNNLPHDKTGNVIDGPEGAGNYIGIDSKNNLLFLDKKIVATVGLEDMLIVDTPDALLVCPKEYAQGVKKIVEFLKEQKLTQYL